MGSAAKARAAGHACAPLKLAACAATNHLDRRLIGESSQVTHPNVQVTYPCLLGGLHQASGSASAYSSIEYACPGSNPCSEASRPGCVKPPQQDEEVRHSQAGCNALAHELVLLSFRTGQQQPRYQEVACHI